MTEAVSSNGSSGTKPSSRRRSARPATVSASALALHLDCSRAYIGTLEAQGVIQRQSGGFSLDGSRVAYLRFLRRERQQSPRARLTTLICVKRPYREAAVLSAEWTSGSLPPLCRAPRPPKSRLGFPLLCHSSRIVTSNASPG